MTSKGKVLVVDDDDDILQLVAYTLSRAGYEVSTSSRGDEGAVMACSDGFDLVVLDMMLPGMDGLSVLREIKKAAPGTEVIMLTAHGSVSSAVESMRMGAFDYISKPFALTDLEKVADRAIEKRRLAQVAKAALSLGGPNGLLDAVAASALSLLGADEVLVLDGAERNAGFRSGEGPPPGWSWEGRLAICRRGSELLDASGGEPAALAPVADIPGMVQAGAPAAAMFMRLGEEGLLCALRAAGGQPFGEGEMRRAKAIGPMVSLALENSRLNARLIGVRLRLAQAQKLESLGLLAGQISHDFNNLLAVITASVQLLMENMRPGSNLKLTEGILDMAREGEGLIRQLMLFARREEGPPAPLDLNRAVNDVKLIISMMTGRDSSVEYRQAPDLPAARIRAGHFKQVLLNLVSNSRKSAGPGAKITVTTRRGLAGEDAPAGLKSDDCVVMEVADDGPGLGQEGLHRVFEPFFSTRPAGEGTGLGLSIVRGVVREAGGDVLACNRAGGGALFRVFLPAC
jgi:signal transduction histidine kinase